MPVGVMLQSMTSAELSEWAAFFRVEAGEDFKTPAERAKQKLKHMVKKPA